MIEPDYTMLLTVMDKCEKRRLALKDSQSLELSSLNGHALLMKQLEHSAETIALLEKNFRELTMAFNWSGN